MTGSPLPSPTFWRDKRVLLTGHLVSKAAGWRCGCTGWAHASRASPLAAETAPALHQAARIDSLIDGRHCDIRDAAALRQRSWRRDPKSCCTWPPRRGAAQLRRTGGHVRHQRDGHRAPAGRAAIGAARTPVAVMVTTDKVYRNNEWPYRASTTRWAATIPIAPASGQRTGHRLVPRRLPANNRAWRSPARAPAT